jgi:enoyl-CoA hydratase/carnithine racemase
MSNKNIAAIAAKQPAPVLRLNKCIGFAAVLAGLISTPVVAGQAAIPVSSTAEPVAQSGNLPAAKREILVQHRSPEYWRVTFDNPPFNIFGPETIPQLDEVITAIETDPNLRVVVFDSAVPGFFLTHYDFVPPLSASTGLPSGRTGLHPLPDMLVRLSRAPVVSISLIRGRATGVGSELALASDMRFASREKAILSQWEVGAALVPGGGPMARLPRLMGRGRALEVLLGSDDIDGDLADKYGYVNRSLPDDQLDGFVDALATRISKFDKQAIADTKRLVDFASLPSDPEIGAGWDAFITSVQRPQAQANISKLMKMGLQTDGKIEGKLGYYTATLSDH